MVRKAENHIRETTLAALRRADPLLDLQWEDLLDLCHHLNLTGDSGDLK